MNTENKVINLYEQEYEINQIISETGLSRLEIKEIYHKI